MFLFYLILFCWLILRLRFFKNFGLDNKTLIFLFLVRIIAGLLNGYINTRYYAHTDISAFNEQGMEEYHLLFNNPGEYFRNIFQSNHNNSYAGFLEVNDSYWNDTRSNLIIKILSLFNIFSRANFFINILFYNFLIFIGTVNLYKVFIHILPSYKKIFIVCIFLIPSTVYFSSAIHRDGLIYLSLCIIVYHSFFLIKFKNHLLIRSAVILCFLILILLLRNFVFIALIPALAAWIIASKRPKNSLLYFSIVYIIIAVLFFSTSLLPSSLNLPAHVSERQIAFTQLAKKGASSININPLFPNFRSFFNNLPQAVNHCLMRPYLTEHNTILYIPAALETMFYELIFIIFIFFRKSELALNSLFYFCIFFSITMFLIIGYTIPILGAIVRYRSIYLPFFLIPILINIDWKKLANIFV